MNDHDDIYSIPQAAKYCSISRVTLWRWVKSEKLKAFITPGGHYRIRKHDLEIFMKGNGMDLLDSKLSNEKKILLVDDDPKIKALVKKILASESYIIDEAADGFEAGLKVMKINPHLIILDLNMPKMDGFEVCREIKENPDTADIKILILTGFDTRENRDRVMQLGADGYLAKPTRKQELLQEVQKLLG